MKIAVRGGHNFLATGARGIIDETTEDRKVKDAVIKYLRNSGHDVLDVTPGNCGVMDDLIYGVNKANNWGAELFVSVHFDKAYDTYNGALGHACWIISSGAKAEPTARNIVNKVSNGTGFKNRGVKYNSSLYELKETNCPAIIVETCFCEATEDVRIYREQGFDKIGRLIAEGISNRNIDPDGNGSNNGGGSTGGGSTPLWQVSISGTEVSNLQSELNKQGFGNIAVDGYFGESTLAICPMLRQGNSGNITRLVQQRLLNRGYSSLNNYGGADGVFGTGTVNAIKALQKNFNLDVDGIIGKNTWKALYSK